MSMESPLDKGKFIEILNRGIDRAIIKCEHYLTDKKFTTATWVFLQELGTVFREYEYPVYGERIKLSKTIGYKIKEVLETIQETEEQRKLIEKIFMDAFFNDPDEKSG